MWCKTPVKPWKGIMKKTFILVIVFTLAGCATKHYPQAPSITGEDVAAFDCNALHQEIAKVHGVQNEIKETGNFDIRTLMGFIGDFGIGNGLAKRSATEKANARLAQLESLQSVKCLPTTN